jgi:hypothetical protein
VRPGITWEQSATPRNPVLTGAGRHRVKGGCIEDVGGLSAGLSITDDLLRRNEPPSSATAGLVQCGKLKPGAISLQSQRANVLATRKPRSFLRVAFSTPARAAERSDDGSLAHEPPRATWTEQLSLLRAEPSQGVP